MLNHESKDSNNAEVSNAWKRPPAGSVSKSEPIKASHLLGIVGLVALLGAVFLWASYRQTVIASGADPRLESEAREFISRQLRDPLSAQFRNIATTNRCVTGEVNAKNGFGGYAGFTAFYFNGRIGLGRIEPSTDATVLGDSNQIGAAIRSSEYADGFSACAIGR